MYNFSCGGEVHRVLVRENGRVTFLDHPASSIQSLAQQCEMLDEKKRELHQCLQAAHALLYTGGCAVLWSDKLKDEDWTLDAIRFIRKESFIDPFGDSIRKRPSYLVQELARDVLQRMSFRTTERVGHEVHVDVTRRVTRVFSKKVRATTEDRMRAAQRKQQVDKTKRALTDSWKMVIHAEVCAKSWARIWRLGVALIDDKHFVIEIVKLRSLKDMRVRFIKQGQGYLLSYGEGDIHKGSDGKWRIIGAVEQLARPINSMGELL